MLLVSNPHCLSLDSDLANTIPITNGVNPRPSVPIDQSPPLCARCCSTERVACFFSRASSGSHSRLTRNDATDLLDLEFLPNALRIVCAPPGLRAITMPANQSSRIPTKPAPATAKVVRLGAAICRPYWYPVEARARRVVLAAKCRTRATMSAGITTETPPPSWGDCALSAPATANWPTARWGDLAKSVPMTAPRTQPVPCNESNFSNIVGLEISPSVSWALFVSQMRAGKG
jgi:hypothetical protein